MGLESGNQNPEKDNVLRSLGKLPGIKEAIVAATLLNISPFFDSVHSDKAYAAEVAPSDTWQKGAERIRELALKNPNEAVAVFLQSDSGEYAWGDIAQLGLSGGHPGNALDSAKKQALELSKRAKTSSIEACVIHTHTQWRTEQLVKGFFSDKSEDKKIIAKHSELLYSGQELPTAFNVSGIMMMPPSTKDLYVLHDRGILNLPKNPGYADKIAPSGITLDERHAAFESNGIWYYENFRSPGERAEYIAQRESEIPTNNREKLASAGADPTMRTWIAYANSYDKNNLTGLLNDPAYRGLQYAYAKQSKGFKLEFVPWSEVPNRQPCSPTLKQ